MTNASEKRRSLHSRVTTLLLGCTAILAAFTANLPAWGGSVLAVFGAFSSGAAAWGSASALIPHPSLAQLVDRTVFFFTDMAEAVDRLAS